MTAGLLGATAIAPINRVLCASVSGIHDAPPSLDFQTPPPAAAMYNTLGSVGSPARPLIRPLVGSSKSVRPFKAGPGPSGVHVAEFSGIELGEMACACSSC